MVYLIYSWKFVFVNSFTYPPLPLPVISSVFCIHELGYLLVMVMVDFWISITICLALSDLFHLA